MEIRYITLEEWEEIRRSIPAWEWLDCLLAAHRLEDPAYKYALGVLNGEVLMQKT